MRYGNKVEPDLIFLGVGTFFSVETRGVRDSQKSNSRPYPNLVRFVPTRPDPYLKRFVPLDPYPVPKNEK